MVVAVDCLSCLAQFDLYGEPRIAGNDIACDVGQSVHAQVVQETSASSVYYRRY